MSKTRTARSVKGVVVSAVAATVCFWIWTLGREWAAGVREASPDAFLAGSLESVLATIAGAASMPVLLWAGMRVARERGHHLLVIVGAVGWLFVGSHLVEDDVSTATLTMSLALFAILGGLLALVTVPEN